MFHIRRHNEYIARPRKILALERGEDDLTLDDVHTDWSGSAVRFHFAARRDGDDRNPQQPLLDEGARATSVSSEQRPVNHPLILFQMVDEYITLEGALHR
jgi:hypothetical protein